MRYHFTVIIEPAEEGGYCVFVPALKGLATQGETLEEARAMARDAISGYLELLTAYGQPIPVECVDHYTEARAEVLEVSVA
jgi:antitoxin HicB